MSKEVVKLVEQGGAPWLTIEKGHLTEASKKAADEVFLKLGGKVFFPNVQEADFYWVRASSLATGGGGFWRRCPMPPR